MWEQSKKAQDLLDKLNTKSTEAAATDKAESFFDPKNWAIGVAMMKNRPSVVSDASVDANGIVRASSSETVSARLLIARHHYFSKDSGLCAAKLFCPGLFIGVGIGGASGSQAIDMLGYGLLLGFSDKNSAESSEANKRHNFGVGWGRRFGVKTLDENYVVGQAAPNGAKQPAYITKDINVRPFLMYSYKF